MGGIDCGTWRSIGPRAARAEGFGYGRVFELRGVFFKMFESLAHEEAVSGDTQGGVMMEAAPAASFEVMQA